MNFFDILRNLFFSKIKNSEDINIESLTQFTPYMINRWLSFYDNNKTIFVNETLNKFTTLFDDKVQMYNLYDNFIPRSKFKKINYVKKSKEKKATEETIDIAMIAKNNMLSVREIKGYIDLRAN